jgi:tetratricopeptide (TPR) repeat protein
MIDDNDSPDLLILEQRAARYPKSSQDLQALADAYADFARWSEAIPFYKAALELDPRNSDLYNRLGIAYDEIDALDEAERAYQQAIVIEPHHASAYYNLATLYEEQNRISEAIQAYEQSLQYASDDEEVDAIRERLSTLKHSKTCPNCSQVQAKTAHMCECGYDFSPKQAEAWDWGKSFPVKKRPMQQEIRSWGFLMLALGIMQIITVGFLDPAWEIMLFLVGAASFFFMDPAMFVVYGVIISWAAITNISSGKPGWVLFIFQIALTVLIFRKYFQYRKEQASLTDTDLERWIATQKERAKVANLLPVASCLFGILAVVSMAASWLLRFLSFRPGSFPTSPSVTLAVLGLSSSLGALLNGVPRNRMSIIGAILSTMVLSLSLGMSVFGKLSSLSKVLPDEPVVRAVFNDSRENGEIGFWIYEASGTCQQLRSQLDAPLVFSIGNGGPGEYTVDELDYCFVVNRFGPVNACTQGTIRVISLEESTRAVGVYDIVFQDNDRKQGTFDAAYCPPDK